jgi:hypothetical protein
MKPNKFITVPRTPGIILIALAVLAYNTQQGMFRTALLVIAGLIFLLTPQASAGKHWQLFVNSLTPTKNFVLLLLFDVVFWAALIVLLFVLGSVLRAPYEQLSLVEFGKEALTLPTLQQNNAITQRFFAITLVSLLVFWLLLVCAYAFSRGLIWLTLQGKSLRKEFFKRFALLNLLWCTLALIIVLFILTAIKPPVAAYAFILASLLYAHLTSVLHYQYTRTNAFVQSLKYAFGIGLGRLTSFVVPFCYLFTVYIILNQLQRFVQGKTALIVTLIIFLVFMAWYRTYMNNMLRHS